LSWFKPTSAGLSAKNFAFGIGGLLETDAGQLLR
jgi:hypothetical protein